MQFSKPQSEMLVNSTRFIQSTRNMFSYKKEYISVKGTEHLESRVPARHSNFSKNYIAYYLKSILITTPYRTFENVVWITKHFFLTLELPHCTHQLHAVFCRHICSNRGRTWVTPTKCPCTLSPMWLEGQTGISSSFQFTLSAEKLTSELYTWQGKKSFSLQLRWQLI